MIIPIFAVLLCWTPHGREALRYGSFILNVALSREWVGWVWGFFIFFNRAPEGNGMARSVKIKKREPYTDYLDYLDLWFPFFAATPAYVSLYVSSARPFLRAVGHVWPYAFCVGMAPVAWGALRQDSSRIWRFAPRHLSGDVIFSAPAGSP